MSKYKNELFKTEDEIVAKYENIKLTKVHDTETLKGYNIEGTDVDLYQQRIILGDDSIHYINMIRVGDMEPMLSATAVLTELGDSKPRQSIETSEIKTTIIDELFDKAHAPEFRRVTVDKTMISNFMSIPINTFFQTKLITLPDLFKVVTNSTIPGLKAFASEFNQHAVDFATYGVVIRGSENLNMSITEKDTSMTNISNSAVELLISQMGVLTNTITEMQEQRKMDMEVYSKSLAFAGFGNKASLTVQKSDPMRDGISMERYCDLLSATVQERIGPKRVFRFLREQGYLIDTLAGDEFTNKNRPSTWYFNNINKFAAPKRLHIRELGANILRTKIIAGIFPERPDLVRAVEMAPTYSFYNTF